MSGGGPSPRDGGGRAHRSSSASDRALDAARNRSSTGASSPSAPAAQSSAAPRRAPRYSSSSGSPPRSHSRAAGTRCRRTARPAASSSSQRASRGHAVSRASWTTSSTSPSTESSRRPTKASTTARRRRVVEIQLGQGQRPADERAAVVGVGQSQEQPARRLLALLVQSGEGGLRRAGERAGDAAGLQVAGKGQPVPPSPFPRADEGCGEQGQGCGPSSDVGHARRRRARYPRSGRRPPPASVRPRAVRRR